MQTWIRMKVWNGNRAHRIRQLRSLQLQMWTQKGRQLSRKGLPIPLEEVLPCPYPTCDKLLDRDDHDNPVITFKRKDGVDNFNQWAEVDRDRNCAGAGGRGRDDIFLAGAGIKILPGPG